MTDLGDVAGTDRAQFARGVVAAPAPADANDELFVTIDAFDGGVSKWGPCPFMPRATTADPDLPAVGDDCLVAFDDTGSPWVVVWTPG